MKTIKRKILTPFLIAVIVIPLITFVVFNVAMRIYVTAGAKAELKNTVQQAASIVDQDVTGSLEGTVGQQAVIKLAKLRAAFRATRFAVNTEVLLFNRKMEIAYSTDTLGSYVSEDLADYIVGLLPTVKKNTVNNVGVDGKRYLVAGYKIGNLAQSPYIVFVTSLNEADAMIYTVDVILMIIMLAGIGIGIVVSQRVSRRIAQPITELCGAADDIGKGKFVPLKKGADMAEIAHLYGSMDQMSARLEAYDKAQKAFLQNASHELRTPLMSIQGYAEGIENGVFSDNKKAAGIIGSESKRLNALVDELLTLSRIENQTYEAQMEKVCLNDALKEYVQRLSGIALKDNLHIDLILPNGRICVSVADTLLSQVVMNITSNGLRYAKTGVMIALEHRENTAVIRISDDGGGISDADLPHLFDRFYKGKGGSFGLGLAIAKSAVEFMGGSITVSNTEKGAEFQILLPILAA